MDNNGEKLEEMAANTFARLYPDGFFPRPEIRTTSRGDSLGVYKRNSGKKGSPVIVINLDKIKKECNRNEASDSATQDEINKTVFYCYAFFILEDIKNRKLITPDIDRFFESSHDFAERMSDLLVTFSSPSEDLIDAILTTYGGYGEGTVDKSAADSRIDGFLSSDNPYLRSMSLLHMKKPGEEAVFLGLTDKSPLVRNDFMRKHPKIKTSLELIDRIRNELLDKGIRDDALADFLFMKQAAEETTRLSSKMKNKVRREKHGI